MTIELLTQEAYDTLLTIQQQYPKLTFQNHGYQYIDRTTFSEEEKVADAEVTAILKNCIKGFSEFNNFKISDKTGEIVIRCQYAYDERFTGVGYVTLRELHEGFDEVEKF